MEIGLPLPLKESTLAVSLEAGDPPQIGLEYAQRRAAGSGMRSRVGRRGGAGRGLRKPPKSPEVREFHARIVPWPCRQRVSDEELHSRRGLLTYIDGLLLPPNSLAFQLRQGAERTLVHEFTSCTYTSRKFRPKKTNPRRGPRQPHSQSQSMPVRT